jgi:diadenosine tetraphosphate (Ap4A) HIT family hydrolase
MTTPDPCIYCSKDSRLTDLMIEVAELDASVLYLFREQTYRGRCIVAFKGAHKRELFELSSDERHRFMDDVALVAAAVQKAFGPQKINYGAYGDKMPHVHFHIVPKYTDAPKWGGTFDMMPEVKVFLTQDQYNVISEEIRRHLPTH